MTYKQHLCEQPIAVATASMVTLLSARIMSSTRCKVAGVAIATSRLTRSSSSILVRSSENTVMGLLDVTGNVRRTRAAFVCGYPLLPYLLPTKTAGRHAVLSWYTYSGAPPFCNSCSLLTVMRVPLVARHNKTR